MGREWLPGSEIFGLVLNNPVSNLKGFFLAAIWMAATSWAFIFFLHDGQYTTSQSLRVLKSGSNTPVACHRRKVFVQTPKKLAATEMLKYMKSKNKKQFLNVQDCPHFQ